MLKLKNINLTYDSKPVLRNVNVTIPEGELVLLAGATGTGKTTLLHVINGLVPAFSGGTLSGEIHVNDHNRRETSALLWSQLVATVAQSPQDSFVAETVEDEIVFGMETHGFSADAMRQRLEEVLDLLSLSAIRNRPLNTLSGGQQQRVAIAAAMTMNPAILLLDEPTSALDPVAADEVMSTIQRLVHDLGLTVLIAEHRIERVMSFADRVLLLDHEGHAQMHSPQEAMRQLPVSPVLTQLADLAGAQESPLTVRDTRRVIEPLRQALSNKRPALRLIAHDAQPAVIVNELSYARGRHVILRDISLTMKTGSITAVMGRNGAGKSTLLHALMGDFSPTAGSVKISGEIPHHIQGSHLLEVVSIVPQQPSDLFLADRVAQECRISDKAHNVESGTTRAILALLAPTIEDSQHPRDLSEGQKLTLALAIALAGSPDVLLLDEPTRGLDSTAKIQLVKFLNEASLRGQTVVLATHDVELAAEVAHNVVVIADGEVVTDGTAAEVLTASAMFAPMTAKVLAPAQWLTVDEIRHAIAEN